MRYVVSVSLQSHTGMAMHGGPTPRKPPQPTATIELNDDKTWNVLKDRSGFMRLFGASSGTHSGWTDAELYWNGKFILKLNAFYVNTRAKVRGRVFWNVDANGRAANYTYFKRIIDPKQMTRAERAEEMWDIAGEEMLLKELGGEASAFLDPTNLAIMAGIFAICVSNPVGWFVGALGILLGASGMLIDLETIAPLWKVYQDRCQYSMTEEDLKEGAQALAQIMAKIIMNIVSGKVMDKAGRAIPWAKVREAFLKKSPSEWEAAAAKRGEFSRAPQRPAVKGALGLDYGGQGVNRQHHYSATHLLEGEFKGYAEMSQHEVIVLREPGEGRVRHMEDGVIATAKHEGMKAKSMKGDLPPFLEPFRNMLGLRGADFKTGGINPRSKRMFDLGHIHQKFKNLGSREAFELLPGTVVEGIPNPKLAHDYLYVKMGDVEVRNPHTGKVEKTPQYLLVDKGMGTPILPDVDVLATAPLQGNRIGQPTAHSRYTKGIPQQIANMGSKYDNAAVGHQRNAILAKHNPNQPLYGQYQHSEMGGSASYKDAAGNPKWNPIEGGKPPNERLIMFIRGECYVFDGWKSFQTWCAHNNAPQLCPWKF